MVERDITHSPVILALPWYDSLNLDLTDNVITENSNGSILQTKNYSVTGASHLDMHVPQTCAEPIENMPDSDSRIDAPLYSEDQNVSMLNIESIITDDISTVDHNIDNCSSDAAMQDLSSTLAEVSQTGHNRASHPIRNFLKYPEISSSKKRVVKKKNLSHWHLAKST